MSKLQIGDEVEVISVDHFSLREQELFNLKVGNNGKIIGLLKICEVFAIVENHKFKNSKAGDGKLYIPKSHLIKIGESQMQYEESNRYKLAQAIKKTGLKVGELSLAIHSNAYYFGNYHKKSRFNDRGDISEARLNELLTDLAFAEREVLGIGAKLVEDENHISKETNSLIYRNSWDEDARKRLNDEIRQSLSNNCAKRSSSRNHDDHVDATSCGFIETDFKEKPKSNKPLFIGVTVVISIVLILFVLNNYLQVV